MDYPHSHSGYDKIWWLKPDIIWGNQFQNQIDKELNENGEIYLKFHKYIKRLLKEKQKMENNIILSFCY